MKIPFVPPKTNIENIFTVLSGIMPMVLVPWLLIQLINLQNFIFIKSIIINGNYIYTILLKLSASAWIIILILLISIRISPKIIKSILNIDNVYDDEAKSNFFKFANLAVNTAITGGASSIIISAIVGIHIEGDILVLEPDKEIRSTILAFVIGILTFLTLTENRRRNDIASSKNDWDKQQTIRMNRRDRYISLVDKLNSENSALRAGAVHGLVLLADEWIDELYKEKNKKEADNILDRDDEELKGSNIVHTIAHKEAQNIVRTLCAYLREPYDLAHKKFVENKSLDSIERKKLDAEVTVRKTIINTYFKNRLNPNYKQKLYSWSHMYFNFSEIVFFYDADFSEVRWNRNVSFKGAIFYHPVDFSNVICSGDKGINFQECTYHKSANLNIETDSHVNFSKSIYAGGVIFNDSMKEPGNIKNILIFKKYNNILPSCAYDNKDELLPQIYQGNDELLNKFDSDPEKFRDDYLEYVEKIS